MSDQHEPTGEHRYDDGVCEVCGQSRECIPLAVKTVCNPATTDEREKVEECTRLLALAQEQQEELVTALKTIRTLTKDVEICAIIDALFINLR